MWRDAHSTVRPRHRKWLPVPQPVTLAIQESKCNPQRRNGYMRPTLEPCRYDMRAEALKIDEALYILGL